jgi:hypothetical protein
MELTPMAFIPKLVSHGFTRISKPSCLQPACEVLTKEFDRAITAQVRKTNR